MPDQPIRLSRLLLLGLLVAVVHVVVLSWLREQLPRFEPLASMAEPLFTRTLEPTAALPPAAVSPTPAKVERPRGPLQAAATLDTTAIAPAASASAASAESTDSAISANAKPAQAPDKTEDVKTTPEVAAAQPPDKPADPAPASPAAPVAEEAKAVAPTPPPAAPAPPAPPDTWPAATRLSYVVTGYYRGDLHGSARVQWQRDGAAGAAGSAPARYQVQLDLQALGITLFTMTSQGEIAPQGLAPRVYEERRPGGVRRVWFEGDSLRLDDGRKLPLPPNAQDTASQFVELGHRFSTGREVLQVGREVTIWLARPGGVDLWTYDVVGEETLRTGDLGNVAAFRLKPRPLANPRGNVTAEIWVAPSLQFLPVRVRISMGQEQGNEIFVDLLVERIEQAAK